jgi:hypothetical protein
MLAKEPTFLVSMGNSSSNIEREGFDRAASVGIDNVPRDIVLDELKDKKIDFGEYKDIEYKGSRTINFSDDAEKQGTFYAVYDEYERIIDDALVTVSYYRDSGKLRSYDFVKLNNFTDTSTPAIDAEQAEKIAEETILSLIDKELFEKYTLIDVKTMPTSDKYCVYYRRQIEGYATEEKIEIYLYENGDIWGILFDNVEKFDNVSAKLTKKKLDAAKDTLTEKIEAMELKDMKFAGVPEIVTDVFGKVYLGICVTHKTEMGSVMETFYISIE